MDGKDLYFKQIYGQSKDKIFRLCLGFMGNTPDAEDLFQEVLIKVWNSLDDFRDDCNIHTWVYRIATNTALNSINKKSKAKKVFSNLETVDFRGNISDNTSLYDDEKIKQLYQAISSLKKIDKIIISLKLDECSYSEIAEITGISISNVGVRLSRIKKSLAKKIT